MKKKYLKWSECLELSEIKALLDLRHPNIVTLRELILSEDQELHLVFEYLNMNLYEFMTKNSKDISEIKIRNIIFQILQGLNYMHKKNFFHRDMKPENILIYEEQVKIADFGLARDLNNKLNLTEYVATRWYRSPEVILKSKNYHSPIDIFSLGAIMAELYNKRPLFPGKSEHEQMNKICEVLGSPNDWAEGINLAGKIGYKFPSYKPQKLKNLVPRASDSAINLMQSMLNFDPEKRPTAGQCLQHQFFQCHESLPYFIQTNTTNSSIHSNKKTENPNQSSNNFDKGIQIRNLSQLPQSINLGVNQSNKYIKPNDITIKKKNSVQFSGNSSSSSFTNNLNNQNYIKKLSLQPNMLKNNLETNTNFSNNK